MDQLATLNQPALSIYTFKVYYRKNDPSDAHINAQNLAAVAMSQWEAVEKISSEIADFERVENMTFTKSKYIA